MSTITTVTNTDLLPPFDPTVGMGASYRDGVTVQQDSGVDPLANKNTFLNLLVAQLKNQDPLNPADGTQFVTQLAQFTQLEQSMGMRQDLDAIKRYMDQSAAAGAETPAAPTP